MIRPPLQVGELVRIRGQSRGTHYRVESEYVQDPITGTWAFLHKLDWMFELGARGRKLRDGEIVRIDNSYYRVRAYSNLGLDKAALHMIGFRELDGLGLPPVSWAPGRPPNDEESRRMADAARQAEIEAEMGRELRAAVCGVCGQQNFVVSDDEYFLKLTFPLIGGERVRRWTCPGGNHLQAT